MNKYNHTHSEGGPTPLDESWWTAVMADEEEFGETHTPKPDASSESKTIAHHPHSRPMAVNWDRARQIYDQDETICLEVFGHNRGGLLVEG